MVETAALLRAGQRSGAIKNDAIKIGIAEGWRLIEAPPPTSGTSYALIFWEPTNKNDRNPTFDKVVRV